MSFIIFLPYSPFYHISLYCHSARVVFNWQHLGYLLCLFVCLSVCLFVCLSSQMKFIFKGKSLYFHLWWHEFHLWWPIFILNPLLWNKPSFILSASSQLLKEIPSFSFVEYFLGEIHFFSLVMTEIHFYREIPLFSFVMTGHHKWIPFFKETSLFSK